MDIKQVKRTRVSRALVIAIILLPILFLAAIGVMREDGTAWRQWQAWRSSS